MASVSLRPITSDRNGRIGEELRAPPLETYPKSSRPLRSRKLVVVKVEPSYISSDLFTPFSEPRSTLPSIAEFVRPSYGSEKTWGTVTSSYGGVGPACQQFKTRGQGSISRSHHHYGSGCINYNSFEDEPENLTIKPVCEHEPAAEATPPRQCERLSFIATKNVPLSVNTASALKNVCATLYGTSSYNKDFASAPSLPHGRRLSTQVTQPIPIQREATDTESTIHTQREWRSQPAKDEELCGKCDLCTEGNQLQENEGIQDQEDIFSCCGSNDEESCSSDKMEEIASNVTTHGHMICISDCTTILPSHVIVTNLSDLPSHFRRVTTKYTRNHCPLLPCRVPHYLLRKHQLLPSVITSLPNRNESRQTSATLTKDINHNRNESGENTTAAKDEANRLPHLLGDQEANRMVVKDTIMLPQRQEVNGRMRWHSHMTQHLGQKFRTEAHTRYHSLFPDHVPDLQTLEPAKRHTFLGYHTSVFRG